MRYEVYHLDLADFLLINRDFHWIKEYPAVYQM